MGSLLCSNDLYVYSHLTVNLDKHSNAPTLLFFFFTAVLDYLAYPYKFYFYFWNIYICMYMYICICIRERGRKRGREALMWERAIDQLPLIHAPTGDQTHNLGMWPDQESNWQPFASQHDAKPNEALWSELSI